MTKTDKRYADLVQFYEQQGHGIVDRPICYLDNWHEISWGEAKTFGINPYLNNRLWLAYTRYQNMLGITDSGIWAEDDAQADLACYGDYAPAERLQLHGVCAARFMSEVCGLPYQDCHGYILFVAAAMERAGLCEGCSQNHH